MTSSIKFGTDGWRGIIAQDFTFDNVRICAQGVAKYIKGAGIAHRGLLVGYDTRFLSEHFAAAVAQVIAANGIKAYLCSKATPTPVISYGVLSKEAAGAIIITASHNPAIWNGFKIKSELGTSASSRIVAEVERNIGCMAHGEGVEQIALAEGVERGLIEYVDLAPDYLSHLGELIDLESIRRAKLKVIVDSMYGAGAGYFREVLGGGNLDIVEINGERNPLFPEVQPEPIASNLAKLSAVIKDEQADVGLATDGDADRLGIVDEEGAFLTSLDVFALLALYFLDVCNQRGAIVKTVTTTSMLYRLGKLFDVPVYETPVGFKYVAPIMIQRDALIGGEESSGFAFRGHMPDRDGILAGLFFLDLMVKMGRSPSELIKYLYEKVGPHFYSRIDHHFPTTERERVAKRIAEAKPDHFDGKRVARIDTLDGFRITMDDESWLLIRLSGTEPLLRIYAEGGSQEWVLRLIEAGKRLAGI